jgi:hypothetical protein
MLDTSQEIAVQEGLDAYIKWRSGLSVGYLLNKQMERNKKNIIGIADLEIYEYEKTHIAIPMDYYCTKPDKIIEWKL